MTESKETLIAAIAELNQIKKEVFAAIAEATLTLIDDYADFKVGEKAKLQVAYPREVFDVEVVSVRYSDSGGFVYEVKRLTKKGAVNQRRKSLFVSPNYLPKLTLIKL